MELDRVQCLHGASLTRGGITFLQKQDIDDSYIFFDHLMEGGMKGHGHSSISCHHVNHTPGLKSKARGRPGLGRQD